MGKDLFLFLILWGLGIVFIFSSCAHTKQDLFDTCNYAPILYAADVPIDIETDELHHRAARAGCIRHYGANSCLIRFTKTGSLSYRALCGRNK